MSTSGSFTGQPSYVRTAPSFTAPADGGQVTGSAFDFTGVPPGAYHMVLDFDNYGYAYDGWLRFSPSVDIHVGGGDNPGPYHHTFTQDVTVTAAGLQLYGEATGGDDMTFQNLTMRLTLIGGRS